MVIDMIKQLSEGTHYFPTAIIFFQLTIAIISYSINILNALFLNFKPHIKQIISH